MRKLTVDDITDLREYEREREEFRAHIIAMKRSRRVALGKIMTATFENADTMRFQVQEMARAERMLSDEQIAGEIEVYNQLVPDDGQLVATVFIEIDDKDALREWLPKLVGVERSLAFRLNDGSVIRGEPIDEGALTRSDVTTTVHYLRFVFTPAQVGAFSTGPVTLAVDHPAYAEHTVLGEGVRQALAGDLDGAHV